MSRRIVQTSERTYLFSPDDPAPLGGRLWELVKLRVIDELNGKPPNSSIAIQAKEKGLVPRVASEGIVGLVGVPQQVFPGLKTINYTVHLTVRAEGYAPRDVEAQVASDPFFPATFTPPPLINLTLHREPVVITGRTVQANGITTTPLAGSTVSVIGIWRTPPLKVLLNYARVAGISTDVLIDDDLELPKKLSPGNRAKKKAASKKAPRGRQC